MAEQGIEIRPIQLGDIAELNRMFRGSYMNDGEHIYRILFETCDTNLWIVAVNEKGEIVANEKAIKMDFEDSSVIYGCRTWIRSDYRGKGLAAKIREPFGNTPSAGIATSVSIGKFSSLRKFARKLQGYFGKPIMRNADTLFSNDDPHKMSAFVVMPLRDEDLEKVVAYDRAIFDCDRSKFTRAWCQNSKTDEPYARTVVGKSKRDGSIVGFGTIRELEFGTYKLIPMYVSNDAVARRMLKLLMRLLFEEACPSGECELRIFVDANNRTMLEFAKHMGLDHEHAAVTVYGKEIDGQPKPELIEKYIKSECVYCYNAFWPV